MVKIIDIRSRTKRTNGTRKLSQVKNIVRHHSATATGSFDTFWNHWHHTKGWGTGGYHEIILRDGSVELCYGPEEITNGVANLNTSIYNICLVGNGSFTDAQEKAFDIRAKRAMKLFGLPVSTVKGHGEMPGAQTSCPGINMTVVRKRLSTGDVVDQVSKPKPAPSKPSVSKPSTNQTNSIVDYLNSKGINSSIANRKKLAAQHGIKNYSGTAAQNTALLNKLRNRPVTSKPSPTKKGNQKTSSIVDYLKSIGQNSSFPNRKKLASKHGIKNYKGTASQNAQLLKKLRG